MVMSTTTQHRHPYSEMSGSNYSDRPAQAMLIYDHDAVPRTLHRTMSRPHLFSAFRAAFGPAARSRPLGGSAFAHRFGFTFGGGARQQQRQSSTVVSTSLKSTLFRPITVLLIFAPILTGYLGVWQVQRLKWKLALIDEIDHNLSKDPIVLPPHVK